MKTLRLFAIGLLCACAPLAVQAQDKDIVDTAIAAGNFTTLVKAVQAAGLVDTLKSAGPFTVFAPNDEAFAKLPPGALEKLLADPAQLKKVLLYHVLKGTVMAASVHTMKAPTAEGASLRIVAKKGKVTVDKATVVKTDIVCSNGVIHVIDSVLMPPKK